MNYDKKFLTSYLEGYINIPRNLNSITDYVQKIPDKLYRFRKCKEIEFDSLNENYIWLSLASEFDDIMDSTIKYDIELDKEKILNIYLEWLPFILKTELSKKKYGNVFSDLNLNKKIVDEYKANFSKDDYNIKNNKVRLYLMSKGLKANQVDLIIRKLNSFICSEELDKKVDQIIEEFKTNMQYLKDYYYVCCFTEKLENDNLWETYADNYTGFCIEYSFDSSRKTVLYNMLYNFAPMLYEEKKAIDLVEIFKIAKKKYCREYYDTRIIHQLELTMNLHSRIKNITYDHEMEWRFFQKKDDIIDRKYCFPFISRIILGKDIKKRNRSRLINIAREKNIEIYQQEYNSLFSVITYKKIDITC